MTVEIAIVSGKTMLKNTGTFVYVAFTGEASDNLSEYTIKFTAGAGITVPPDPVPIHYVMPDPLDLTKTKWVGVAWGAVRSNGASGTITATPLKKGVAQNSLAKHISVRFVSAFGTNAGLDLVYDRVFVPAPCDPNTPGQYIRLSMEAGSSNNDVMARFSVLPATGYTLWTDTNPAVQLKPAFYFGDSGQDGNVNAWYAVSTDSDGVAAVRLLTTGNFMAATVTSIMEGVDVQQEQTVYFAKQPDVDDEQPWIAPTYVGPTDGNGNIAIPEFGIDNYQLNIPVYDSGDNIRFIVINNSTVYAYDSQSSSLINQPWSTLVTDTENKFTYYSQTSDDNALNYVGCTPTAGKTAIGAHLNLPDATLKPRVCPAPVVVPAPGLGSTIDQTVINSAGLGPGLFLSLTDFPKATLTGYDGTTDLTAIFRFYLNGYERKGSDRPGRTFSSDNAADGIIGTTVSIVSDVVTFAASTVHLSRTNALNWGKKQGAPLKQVGFDYYITYKTGPNADKVRWYSQWDTQINYYQINTGNW